MPWWLIWVLLVLAALTLLVWIGLRLWRAFRALLAEVERAQEVLGRLEERMAELEELGDAAAQIVPELVIDPERRAELAEARNDVRRTRRARKQARHERAVGEWDAITGEERLLP